MIISLNVIVKCITGENDPMFINYIHSFQSTSKSDKHIFERV